MAGNNFISNDKINEVRSSVDIVDVISEYLPLTGKGNNFFGVCPFHDDHSPSMSVNKTRQIYKCFSCGAGGNVFTFISDYENISFIEAVKKVADRVGIPLDIHINESFKKKDSKYYEMYDIALKFYTNNLYTKEGSEAIKYLEDRKITSDVCKEFEIGLSLKNSHLLTGLLEKKGYANKDLIDSGLVIEKDNEMHDIYYNRIMFPLYDLTGRIVAFSGRIYRSQDSSKYINTKETEIFKKGELLYHYHKARNIARVKDEIIIVEGFMDVIRLFTIGIQNVVATMGTSVTKEQLNLIKKMAKEIILMFDGDSAGKHAAYKTSTELIKMGITPKIVILEDDLDPDEYILKFGKEKMEYKLEHPMSVIDFKLDYLKEGKDIESPQGKAEYITLIIELLNEITDPILRETTILRVSEETKFDAELIRNRLKVSDNKNKKEVKIKNIPKQKRCNRYEEAERRLIFYMLESEEIIKLYQKKVKFLSTEKYRLLAKEINFFYEDYGYIKEADFINVLHDEEELLKTLKEITALPLKDEYTKEEIDEYINTIYEYKILKQISYLKDEQKKTFDQEKKTTLGMQILELMKQLQKDELMEEL